MSKRVHELFLFDIYVAIIKIENVAKRFATSQDLLHDFVSWDSVIREFEIIGEATNLLIKEGVLDEDNRVVVDFRNLLIHHYFGIDPDEVWNVIGDNLQGYKAIVVEKIKLIENALKNELIESLSSEYAYIDFVVLKLAELK